MMKNMTLVIYQLEEETSDKIIVKKININTKISHKMSPVQVFDKGQQKTLQIRQVNIDLESIISAAKSS